MLTRRTRLGGMILLVALSLTAGGALTAGAAVTHGLPHVAPSGPGGDCPDHDPDCHVWDDEPGGGGGGGGGGNGGGGGAGCSWQGESIPCNDPDLGTYVGKGCYQKLARLSDPAPPGGEMPGSWYAETCLFPGGNGSSQRFVWIVDNAPTVTPAQLAQRALASITLRGADIGMAPAENGRGAVGLPVWLWTGVSPNTWGPVTASASGGGLTVTITAQASRIHWDMGDGGAVSCANPGTQWQPSFGFAASPSCPYTYARPSTRAGEPDRAYTITATTTWTVNWTGGGQSGVITTTRTAQTTRVIQDIQVVNR